MLLTWHLTLILIKEIDNIIKNDVGVLIETFHCLYTSDKKNFKYENSLFVHSFFYFLEFIDFLIKMVTNFYNTASCFVENLKRTFIKNRLPEFSKVHLKSKDMGC